MSAIFDLESVRYLNLAAGSPSWKTTVVWQGSTLWALHRAG